MRIIIISSTCFGKFAFHKRQENSEPKLLLNSWKKTCKCFLLYTPPRHKFILLSLKKIGHVDSKDVIGCSSQAPGAANEKRTTAVCKCLAH